MNDEPPVRNTWSIPAAVMPALASASSTVSAMRSTSGLIQASNRRAVIDLSNIDTGVLKGELGALLRGQLLLGARDRTIEQEAEIVLDDRDEPVQRLRIALRAGQACAAPSVRPTLFIIASWFQRAKFA